MGYRNYIASIPKRKYNKIKKMDLDPLFELYGATPGLDEDGDRIDYLSIGQIVGNDLYELGKYVDEFPSNLLKPFFLNKETQKYYEEDHEFYVVGKEFILAVIQYYKGKIKRYYTGLLDPLLDITSRSGSPKENFLKDTSRIITEEDVKHVSLIVAHLRDMAHEWGVFPSFFGDGHEDSPFDLDEGKERIISSWKYEYAIFELVRIYKSFDWKRQVMVYYGG